MLPTTILIDEVPRCVVRPTDTKDLNRFIRNGKTYLLAENADGKITHRNADDAEVVRWRDALALHKAWGGAEEDFFGTPLPPTAQL
jgi:hypothetical protein